MTVLIISQDNDVHADYIAKKIKNLKGEAKIFKRYNKNHFFTFKFKNFEKKAYLSIDNKKLCLKNDIQSIFWRVKPFLLSELPGAQSSLEDKFRSNEWMHAISSIENFLDNKKIIINPIKIRLNMNKKIIQKQLALDCNLKMPNTIISNNSREIYDFLNNNKIIYKTLSSFMTEKDLIFTNQVSIGKINNSSTSIALAPGIFQTLIEKKFEFRITIIGNKVYTTKIESQKKQKTSIDWRYEQNKEMFSKGELKPKTKENLLKFHKKSGLIFATYDFIVDKDNNEIFLECNPNGQWLFLEENQANQISQSIAEKLLYIN